MARERLVVTPITDATVDSLNRLVTELNTALEKASNKLPNVDAPIRVKLQQNKATIAAVLARQPTTVPTLKANPVDVLALRNDLDTNIIPAIKTEQAAIRKAIDELAKSYLDLLGTLE